MARKLIVCLDGTGNEIGPNISNVLKLYRMIEQNGEQLVYYDPGVGTIGQPDWWSQLKAQVRGVLGLALGVGFDENVLDAYAWLCRNWREGDEIFLFGFSRGSYTARVIAGFIRFLGLLGPDQLNLCGYALVAYKKASDSGELEIGDNFRLIAGTRDVRIRFVGCWDTVSSLIIPRPDRFFIPQLQTLLYTRNNNHVECFRHAISIDERRRMFRLNHWAKGQQYQPLPPGEEKAQSVRQVWFAGVHSDVGGGYPEEESGLSKYPLLWMVRQAQAAGLAIDAALRDQLADGKAGAENDAGQYVEPDFNAPLHRSLAGAWWVLEPFPKSVRLKEWPRRIAWLIRYYIPWAEPRPIPNRPWQGKPADEPFFIHSSVLARIAANEEYRPVNLPAAFEIETADGPPVPADYPKPPYRTPGMFARIGSLLTTWPGRDWLRLGKEMLWLLPLLGLLGWFGGYLHWGPDFGPGLLTLALVAFFAPALVEEIVFRGALLKPPSDGASGLGPAALSALLFAAWHPLAAWLLCRYLACPGWNELASNWWFLGACAALGLACARLVLAIRSLWPAVLLHWLVIMAWKTLFGGPGLPPALGL